MERAQGTSIHVLRVRGSFPNQQNLIASLAKRVQASPGALPDLPGYSPPVVEFEKGNAAGGAWDSIAVRDIDLPLLCQPDDEQARRYLELILSARSGDRRAAEQLSRTLRDHFRQWNCMPGGAPSHESRFVVPSTSASDYAGQLVSQKAAMLLKLGRQGYPVPDFVVLSAEVYLDRADRFEKHLGDAIGLLEDLTCQVMGASEDPLVVALRCAMPHYAPGLMPTYLNVGVTESTLPALERIYGLNASRRMYLNVLDNICKGLDLQQYAEIAPLTRHGLQAGDVTRLTEKISEFVKQEDRRLVEDPFHQAAFLARQAYQFFEDNQALIFSLSRSTTHYPSLILQKMICTVRHTSSYAGVLYSRHPMTGEGMLLETAHDIFGEEIMTGTVEGERTSFEDRETIRDEFPAVYHFAPKLPDLESQIQAPVTIEFVVDATDRCQMFALLQLNETGMTGRAAFTSVVDMHKSGTVTSRRVTELICPFHVKQMESDTIDETGFHLLDRFCTGVAVLPRTAISVRIYFTAEAALEAKRRGEPVCFCKRAFTPTDTTVMREVDAIASLTSVAIHVVTICQSLGSPALLNLESDGVSIQPDGTLFNAAGDRIVEGDWITISSRRQSLYQGKARFKPARLMRFMNGETVDLEPDEQKAFDDMAYAYRYYQQLIKGLEVDQISKLSEIIRLVSLDLRGEADVAMTLVQGWFDRHETFYMEEVLRSEMGDHLNQNRVFDMLTLDRKVRFFKQALAKCSREQLSGLSAGTFMLGRFISVPQPVAFWRSFTSYETGLLLNEWVLFEQYLQVLDEVGERKIMRARKRIMSEGLGEIHLHPGNVKCLVPLKLSGISLDAVQEALPDWSEPQTIKVLEILKQPYGVFFDFEAGWSVRELETLCLEEDIPIPGPDDM